MPSPTLQERALQFTARLLDYESRELNKGTLDKWRPIRARLADAKVEAEALDQSLKVLKAKSIYKKTVGKDSKLCEYLNELQKRLETGSDGDALFKGNLWGKTESLLKNVEADLRKGMASAWKSHISSILPNIDHLRGFSDVSTCASSMQKIERKIAMIKVIMEQLPSSELEVVNLEKELNEVEMIIKNELDFGDIPPAVQDFLKRVNSLGGVTLAELKSEVLQWLSERKLLKSFKVHNS